MAGGWGGRNAGRVLGDLGDGLFLRRAEPEDAEAIVAFNARVHHSPGGPFERREPHAGVAAMSRDLLSGDHPACGPGDFTVVEDTATGSVVSSACLIEQRFSYGGVEVRAGLPELIGTHPDYRRRGLVREQMAVLHAWSRQRGHLMQAIAGIPNFYRRFGYEMAVWMGSGRRLYARDLPHQPSGGATSEATTGQDLLYPLRPATVSDAPFLADLDLRSVRRYLLASPRDAANWRFGVAGRDPESDEYVQVKILERPAGEAVGYVCHARDPSAGTLRVYAYELADGVSWLEANPFVLNALVQAGEERPDSLTFSLGQSHPLYEAFPDPPLYDLDRDGHYSFYVRIPDLPAFLLQVAPVLEERLADSVAAGHTATLDLNFYSSGLRLEIVHGHLEGADLWNPTPENSGDAAFPDLTFLRLLFGHHSLEELSHTFPDCSPGGGDTQALLKALFPKRPSNLQPVC
jgi:GNAT superfamily N-acetyltransferase